MAIQRPEILDYQTYSDQRPELRAEILAIKAARRIEVAEVLTFLFENHATIRYQIHEMLRVERIVREAEIAAEIATYNELLGGPGVLGCTLLISIDDPAERAVKLREWLDLPRHLYLRVADADTDADADAAIVRATWDPRQVGDDRLSAVQYLKFPVGGRVPLAIGVDHPSLRAEVVLDETQRAALRADLAEGRSAC